MSPHLFQLARRSATIHANAPAIIEGEELRTWAETYGDMEKMAAGLLFRNVSAGDRVGILAANSGAYIRALFAIPRIGAIATPLNTRLVASELAELAEDAGISLLLCDESHWDMGETLLAQGIVASIAKIDSLTVAQDVALPPEPDGDQTAFILYTGGSTGRSKGVMHSCKTLIANAYQSSAVMGDTTDMRFLYVAPLFHVGALAYTVVMALHGGANVPLATFDPVTMLDQIARHRVTHVAAVPTMLGRVIEAPELAQFDISSLRRVIYGASPISESLLLRALSSLPRAEFVQSYGQTETVTLTLLPPARHVIDGPLAGKLKCAGCATPGVDLRVVDDDGVEVPAGVLGEIVARSAAIMPGYWNRPDATADTIRGGWLYTGDIGFLDTEGFVTLVDRKKDMIISGGENISSVEVEDALARHDAILECAVIGIADPDWGERVHAVVRLRDGEAATEDEIIAHCRQVLASYKCPRSVTISAVPLPLSGAGKVLKRELRDALNKEMASA